MTTIDPGPPPDGARPGGDPALAPQPGGRRPGRRRTAVIAIALVTALVVVVVAVGGWRWRQDRAYVGTEVAAELRWGMCTNGIEWRDPATGVEWWGGDEIVTTGDYESEPRRYTAGPATPTEGRPMAYVTRHSVGTVRFDSYDRATFTSRTGGTLALQRIADDQLFTAQCAQRDVLGPEAGDGPARYEVALHGVLGRAASVPGEPAVLAPGTVRVVVDGAVVAETPVTTGEFTVHVPVLGAMTVEGDLGDGTCATDTRTIVSGVPEPFALLCGPSS